MAKTCFFLHHNSAQAAPDDAGLPPLNYADIPALSEAQERWEVTLTRWLFWRSLLFPFNHLTLLQG